MMFTRRIARIILFLFIFSGFLAFFPHRESKAAGALLYLSPAKGSFSVGDTFNVNIVVNSGGGDGINASDGTITFDSKYLVIKKVSKDSSIFNLWTSEPSFSNSSNKITYSGGKTAPGYTGSAGTIMSITFMALAVGETNVDYAAASVLAADGKGTNVLTSAAGATYTISEKKKEEPKKEEPKKEEPKKEEPKKTEKTGLTPPPPKVKSTTHPDENTWYSNSNPEFDWKLLADVNGVSFSLDIATSADPGPTSYGIIENKKFAGAMDGKNFFHIKFQNQFGWGAITHRQTLIDSTPPLPFEIIINNGGDQTDPSPKVVFEAIDIVSGIKNYKIKLDKETKELTKESLALIPYTLPILKPGEHKLDITAFDYADNRSSSTKIFIVEALKPPVITEMPRVINKGDDLAIQGTSFYSNVNIELYAAKSEKEVKVYKIKTDEDGNWTYLEKSDLAKGVYKVWAKIIDDRGAESNDSMKKTLTVQSPSIVCLYGWWIIFGLLMLLIGLVIYMIYLNKQFCQQKERALRESQELEKRVSEIFTALKDEVGELMETADKKSGLSDAEKRAKDKIFEALDISQEFIGKEIKDVKKEIE